MTERIKRGLKRMKKMIEREISYLNLQCIHEPLHNELSRVYSDIENMSRNLKKLLLPIAVCSIALVWGMAWMLSGLS